MLLPTPRNRVPKAILATQGRPEQGSAYSSCVNIPAFWGKTCNIMRPRLCLTETEAVVGSEHSRHLSWVWGQITAVWDSPELKFPTVLFIFYFLNPKAGGVKSLPPSTPTPTTPQRRAPGVFGAGVSGALPVQWGCASSSVPVRGCPPAAEGDGGH